MSSEVNRGGRKLDHLRLALTRPRRGAGWEDVHLVHNSLPEAALAAVDVATHLAGHRLPVPLLLNAMTGGVAEAGPINATLGRVAGEMGLPIAVGSQRAALADRQQAASYLAVRRHNPDGLVLANLGAGATVAEARRAVDMVGAGILQLHLNAPQELQMPEGDRDFRGQLAAIGEVVAALNVPVLVKECGFGLSAEAARRLHAVGVRLVDVAGRGGTNFARIEQGRAGGGGSADPGLLDWGIPTVAALIEVLSCQLEGLAVVASGGIAFGSDAAKALAVGASATAVAGPAWRALAAGGEAGLRSYLHGFVRDLRTAVLLTGAPDLEALRRHPVVLTGFIRSWVRQRAAHWDSSVLSRRPRA